MTLDTKLQMILKVLTVLDKVIDFVVGLINERVVSD